MVKSIFCSLVLLFTMDTAFASNIITGEAHIIDGDTLRVKGDIDNKVYIVRLAGIDAPEIDQECKNQNGEVYNCGIAAKKHLQSLLNPQKYVYNNTIRVYFPVICEIENRDRYGRYIGKCTVKTDYMSQKSLNFLMVKDGWAVAYYNYSWTYVGLEKLARLRKVGLWAGEFINPVEHRKGVKQ